MSGTRAMTCPLMRSAQATLGKHDGQTHLPAPIADGEVHGRIKPDGKDASSDRPVIWRAAHRTELVNWSGDTQPRQGVLFQRPANDGCDRGKDRCSAGPPRAAGHGFPRGDCGRQKADLGHGVLRRSNLMLARQRRQPVQPLGSGRPKRLQPRGATPENQACRWQADHRRARSIARCWRGKHRSGQGVRRPGGQSSHGRGDWQSASCGAGRPSHSDNTSRSHRGPRRDGGPWVPEPHRRRRPPSSDPAPHPR